MNHKPLLAQLKSTNPGLIGEGPGFGPFSSDLIKSGQNVIEIIARIISAIIGVITISAGIYFIFQFLIGAFGWLTASGDKTRLQTAQDRLTHATIGLIIVVGAMALISLVASVMGFELFLLRNPKDVIDALTP